MLDINHFKYLDRLSLSSIESAQEYINQQLQQLFDKAEWRYSDDVTNFKRIYTKTAQIQLSKIINADFAALLLAEELGTFEKLNHLSSFFLTESRKLFKEYNIPFVLKSEGTNISHEQPTEEVMAKAKEIVRELEEISNYLGDVGHDLADEEISQLSYLGLKEEQRIKTQQSASLSAELAPLKKKIEAFTNYKIALQETTHTFFQQSKLLPSDLEDLINSYAL